ncbi:MAG TPA: hypothetical protein VEV17_19610 [Bryobacteraceae bacterium]|nr:hypothetical protein [Bryobacteraceae bacterium]
MKRIGLGTAFLFMAWCGAVFGGTLVVPNSQATAPGNLGVSVGADASRLQEVVGGGQFLVPLVITGLRVRAAPGSGPVSFNYSSLQITLSSTQAFPNTNNGRTLPSTTFANNVGPDATVVFNGPFSASSPGCAAPGPCPFDMAIPFTTPFPYGSSPGRLLVDIVTSATNGAPKGSLDGVGFPDSSSSSVAIVTGDPTQATGSLSLGGLVLGLDSGTPAGTSFTGSFGFLLNAWNTNSAATGAAFLGVMNFQGAGNVTGSYSFVMGGNNAQAPQSSAGTFTGTYSNNSDGTGSVTIAFDIGFTVTLATVITDGGQGLQLAMTNCSGGCNINGTEVSGFARAAYTGSPNGSYGFQLNNSPLPAGTIGVVSFDNAGNAIVSFTSVGVGGASGQPPVSAGTLIGTYTMNPDGSGAINVAAAGQGANSTFAMVITDGGSGIMLLLTNGTTGNSVSFGSGRVQ